MSNGGNNNFEINPQIINIEVSEFRGRSAYQLWLDAGNTGSLEDFFLAIGTFNPEVSASLVDTFETKGSGILSGSVLNYIPVIVSESSQIQINSASGFITFSSSVDSRLINLENFSSSLDANFATDAEVSASQQFTLNYINTFTQSYYVDSSSIDSRLDLLESQSGSSQTSFNEYTSSTDLRLQSLETESGSIRLEFNSFTSSQNIINGDVNDDLNTLFNSTNALSAATSSYETKGAGIVSGSSQLTSSYDERYILSGSIAQTTWENIDGKPSGLISSSQQIENDISGAFTSVSESIYTNIVDIDVRLDNLELESGSIRLSFNSYTSSNDTLNTNQNNRLQSLETESGSIRSTVNSFTSSTDLRLQSLETESGSVRLELNQYTQSTDSRLDTIESFTSSYATTGSNTFNGNQIINGDLFVDADTLVLTGSIVVDGQIQTTGITGSLRGTADTASYVSYTNIDGLPTLVSGSSQLTSSYDERYILSGSLANTTWESVENKPIDIFLTGSHTTSDITEGTNLFYRDDRVKDKLNTETVVSSSSQIQLSGITGTTFNTDNFTFPQDLTVQGRLTAQEFYTELVSSSVIYESGSTKFGDTEDDTHQFTGSVLINGNLEVNGGLTGSLLGTASTASYVSFPNIDNLPTLISGSSQLTSSYDGRYELQGRGIVSSSQQIESDISGAFTSTSQSISSDIVNIDNRLDLLEIESSSIRITFNSYTSSNDTLNTTQNSRLTSLETESGSIRTTFNSYTQSSNLRLQSLETESGSVKGRLTNIENFTSSQSSLNGTFATTGSNTFEGNQTINGELFVDADTIEFTGSFSVSGGITGSLLGTASTASYVSYTNIGNLPTLVSGSSQLTSSYDSRYILSGSITAADWNTLLNRPVGIVSQSSQIQLESVGGFTTYSQSVNSRLDGIEQYTSSTNLRLQSIETESSSIRTELNTYSSSTDNRLNSLETESGSVKNRLSTIESFTSSYATTGSNIFSGNQTINGDLIIDGDLTAKNFYIDSASVIYTSGSTKFGDTIDDIHEFTGSVKITGSLELNGLPIGTGKLDETVFNSYTSSTDNRIQSLETESGSIRLTLNSYTQSTDSRLDTIESISGSWVSSDITSSTLITASVFENVITFTKGDNTTFDITVQASGSVIPGLISGSDQLTSSYDGRYELQGSGILSGSYSFNDLTDLPTLISGSSQLTSSYDERYILSGSITAADWNTLLNIPSGIVSSSSQIDLTQTTNYTEFSSSINDTFASQSIRLDGIDTFTSSIDGRVDNIELTTASFDLRLGSLETESGSIRTELNNYTQSTDDRLSQLETESGSVISRLSNIESFTSSIDTTIKTKLDVEGVVSSSSQIQIESVSGFTTYSSSVDLRLGLLETESGSIRLEFNQFTSSYNTGSFSGSFIGDLTGNADSATSSQTSISASYALTASYIDGGFY